nr:ribosomal protein S17 [Chroomonas debatzensis]
MPIKERFGTVVSDKMDKTVVVSIENKITHKKYGKIISRTKRYKVHDETNTCTLGDSVIIVETRPLSKTKRWAIKEIKQKAIKLNLDNIGE